MILEKQIRPPFTPPVRYTMYNLTFKLKYTINYIITVIIIIIIIIIAILPIFLRAVKVNGEETKTIITKTINFGAREMNTVVLPYRIHNVLFLYCYVLALGS
jgi:hypothetical protein